MAASLLYAPYLSLSGRAEIGGWEFIGVGGVTEDAWTSSEAATIGAQEGPSVRGTGEQLPALFLHGAQ